MKREFLTVKNYKRPMINKHPPWEGAYLIWPLTKAYFNMASVNQTFWL